MRSCASSKCQWIFYPDETNNNIRLFCSKHQYIPTVILTCTYFYIPLGFTNNITITSENKFPLDSSSFNQYISDTIGSN